MNKARVEALTDGVYAIVMTLLVLDLRVPENIPLGAGLAALIPVFISYVLSFIVLSIFWLSHHALFHLYFRTVNRQLILFNAFLLMFIALIPFSAHLVGAHPNDRLAAIFYGGNIIAIGIMANGMFWYGLKSREIDTSGVTMRTKRQAAIRLALTPIFAAVGIGLSYISIPLALVVFAFPIVFNSTSQTLNAAERLFGFDINK